MGRGPLQRLLPSLRWVLQTVVAVILLILVFRYVSVSEVANAFSNSRPLFLIGGFLLVGANLSLQVLKWRYFIRLINLRSGVYETTAAVLLGITLGTVTPGQLGELGGRALRHAGSSSGVIVGLTFIDKLQMLCIMGIAGTASFVILLGLDPLLRYVTTIAASVVFLLVFFRSGSIAIFVQRISPKILQRLKWDDFLSAFQILKPRNLLISFGLSLTFYAILFLQMFLLLNAFEPVGVGDAFLGFSAMMFFKTLVPLSIGDLGIREASSVYFYSLCGIAHATALNASLLLFLINIVLPSLVGLVFIPEIRRR